MSDTSSGPVFFTVREAAEACQVSRRTIQRRIIDLGAHGAHMTDAGAWRIPVEALIAVGLTPGKPAAPDGAPGGPRMVVELVTIERAEYDRLRHDLAVARTQATERERTIDALSMAMRQIEAATTAPGPPAATEAPEKPRRRWFGRS